MHQIWLKSGAARPFLLLPDSNLKDRLIEEIQKNGVQSKHHLRSCYI